MPHRQAAKIDANQPAIVDTARKLGASVQILAAVGDGCPDILVGYRNQNILCEIKDGDNPPSARKLNDKQETWHNEWRGQVCIIESVQEMIDLISKLARAAS